MGEINISIHNCSIAQTNEQIDMNEDQQSFMILTQRIVALEAEGVGL
jgi:hypothetical protein